MASKNVETLRAAHESWNKRDFAGVVKNAAEKLTYTDSAAPSHSTAGTSSGNGRKDGRRPFPTAASPTPSTSMPEIL